MLLGLLVVLVGFFVLCQTCFRGLLWLGAGANSSRCLHLALGWCEVCDVGNSVVFLQGVSVPCVSSWD